MEDSLTQTHPMAFLVYCPRGTLCSKATWGSAMTPDSIWKVKHTDLCTSLTQSTWGVCDPFTQTGSIQHRYKESREKGSSLRDTHTHLTMASLPIIVSANPKSLPFVGATDIFYKLYILPYFLTTPKPGLWILPGLGTVNPSVLSTFSHEEKCVLLNNGIKGKKKCKEI